MPKLSQPIMAALAELHHARAARVARTPGYARRLRRRMGRARQSVHRFAVHDLDCHADR
jgi:hypothetical protein